MPFDKKPPLLVAYAFRRDDDAHPLAFVLMSHGIQKILITNPAAGTVEVVDLATLASEKVVAVGKSPNAISLSADGRWVFISNSGANTLSVIDLKTLEVARTITVGNGPAGMSYVQTN